MFSLIRHEAHLGSVLSVFCCESYKNRMREAEEIIRDIDGLSDQKKAQYLKRYKEDYKKTRANFGEWYYGYKMYTLSGKEKKSFLTTQDIIAISKKYELLFPEQLPTTKYKDRFLRKYAAFVHRKWIVVTKDSDPEEIDRFIAANDTIVKPTDSSRGKGIINIEGNKECFRNRIKQTITRNT